MKTRANLYVLRNDREVWARQTHPALCYFFGLPPGNCKGYLPSVNLPPSLHMLGPRCLTHIWQRTYCLLPWWTGNAGHLGSVFMWGDSSCGKLREWQALAALLTSGKEEGGEQKGDVSLYPAARSWLFCKRTHRWLTFPTVNRCSRRETLCFYKFNLQLLVHCGKQTDVRLLLPQNLGL